MNFRTEGTGLLLEVWGGLSPQGAPCTECTADVASLMPQKHGQEGEQPVSPPQGEPILFTFPLVLSGKILCIFSAFDALSGMGFPTWAAAGIRMEPGTAWDCSPGCSQGFCRAGGSDPHLSSAEGQPKTCARLSGLIFLPQQWQLVSPLCLPLPPPCLTTSLRLRCQPNGQSSGRSENPQSLGGTTSQGRPFWDLDLGLHCWCLLESRPMPVSHVLWEHLNPCTIPRTSFHSDFTDVTAGLFVVPSPNKQDGFIALCSWVLQSWWPAGCCCHCCQMEKP